MTTVQSEQDTTFACVLEGEMYKIDGCRSKEDITHWIGLRCPAAQSTIGAPIGAPEGHRCAVFLPSGAISSHHKMHTMHMYPLSQMLNRRIRMHHQRFMSPASARAAPKSCSNISPSSNPRPSSGISLLGSTCVLSHLADVGRRTEPPP